MTPKSTCHLLNSMSGFQLDAMLDQATPVEIEQIINHCIQRLMDLNSRYEISAYPIFTNKGRPSLSIKIKFKQDLGPGLYNMHEDKNNG